MRKCSKLGLMVSQQMLRQVMTKYSITYRTFVGMVVLLLGFFFFFSESFSQLPNAFFYMDDYLVIQSEKSLHRYVIEPYGGHVFYVSALVWRGTLRIFGADSYYPFLLISLVITAVNAVFLGDVLRRIGTRSIALVAVFWSLYFGPAFHNQLWTLASLNQLASISVLGLIVLNTSKKSYLPLCFLFAVIGVGVGGLGVGVAVSLICLTLLEHRFLFSSLLIVLTAFAVLVARSSLAATGNNPLALQSFSKIPYYLISALSGTIQASLNIPSDIAAVGTVAVILSSIAALLRVKLRVDELYCRAVLSSGSYLITTWGLAGLVRSDLSEVAAPRYIGATAPMLLIYVVALYKLLVADMDSSREKLGFQKSSRVPRFFIVVILVATVSNLGIWVSSRENANYLGSVNLAKLAAIYYARAWINPDFQPSGEGLTYVRASLINNGWDQWGSPDFISRLNSDSKHRGLINSQWLSTLVEAGLVNVDPSKKPQIAANNCLSTLKVPTSKSVSVNFHGVDGNIKIKNNFSDPVDIPGTTGAGVIKTRSIQVETEWTFQVKSGCISPR